MLRLMSLNVRSRLPDANTQQSELTQSSSVAHTPESMTSQAVRSSEKQWETQEALLFWKLAFSEACLMQP